MVTIHGVTFKMTPGSHDAARRRRSAEGNRTSMTEYKTVDATARLKLLHATKSTSVLPQHQHMSAIARIS